MTDRRFLRFYYAAIKRYGDKRWTAHHDVIEFNPNYTVSVSGLEKEDFDYRDDKPYVVELSNGTKFLCFFHNFGDDDIELTTKQGGTRFITNYHQAAEDMDGKAATDDIRDILNMSIADDEYIPSLGELYFILAHFTQINAALKAVGGEPLHDDWYWSSTQYSATNAWTLYLNYGLAGSSTKATYQSRVRPVSAFLPLNS